MSTATDDIIQILNPSDCFTLAMDEEIRQENMPGSQCGFALELASSPDANAIQQRINEFGERFPLVLPAYNSVANVFLVSARTTTSFISSTYR